VTAQDPVVEQALAGAFAAAGRVEGMRGLAVARDGELLAQRYYNGSGPYVVHDVRSVTKSVVSILIGIAIDRGLIESVDQTLADYLGGVVDSLDAAKGSITIRNLLTMSAGHRWQGLGSVHEWGDWMNAPDQITYVLEKPLVDAPGTRFNYSDGSAHLLSVILTEATGMRAVDFAAEHLFEPLGIGPRFWLTDNRGYSLGAAGIRLTPLDMLAIGALYLDGGVARGQRVVSEEWVSTSTRAHISTDDAVPYGTSYGYLWWLGRAGDYEFYHAMGYGGQFIVNVPDLRLTVVATCDWRYPISVGNRHWYDVILLIVTDVIPAMAELPAGSSGP
jgi:CubicO group peptidase (beta-lactamase class C family)